MLLIATEAIQVMQDNPYAWFVEVGLPVLFLAAIPAFVLYWMVSYMEAAVYDSHRPRAAVPKNARQWRVISMYRYHRQQLDFLLLILYVSSVLLAVETIFLVGGIQGFGLCVVVTVMMLSPLRHGIHLESRMERKLAEEKRILDGSARLFG